jgi:ComF family protein
MREAIHALKYNRLRPIARRLGAMLAEAIGPLKADSSAPMLVIPVPLHRSKFASRGFNQARLLAAEALAALSKTHPDWKLTLASTTVVRQRATESQAGLTPRQRRLNVRGAFLVANPAAVSGKHVLVIDDILTTGATARSVAQVLIRAGAAKVWVATLARARHAFGYAGFSEHIYSERERGSGDDPATDEQIADFHAGLSPGSPEGSQQDTRNGASF